MSFDVTSLIDRHASKRWERINVGDILERNTWGRPEHTAIVGWTGAYAYPDNGRLCYLEADALQNRIANALLGRGLRRGDRVLLFCENSVEAFITKLAIAKAGLVGAPLNPNLATDVLDILIERLQPAFTIADAEFAPRIRPSLERAEMVLDVVLPLGESAVEHDALDFAEFVRSEGDSEPDVETHGDDIWEILFTSGTTAAPKGAMLSHVNTQLAAMSFSSSLTRGLRREHDLVLQTFLPVIYHVSDHIYALSAWTSGGTLIIGRRPDADAGAQAIDREKVTALWGGNPLMLKVLADAAERDRRDLSTLSFASFCWASIDPELYQRYQALAGPEFQFVTHLGQTEAASCLRFYFEEEEDKFFEHAPVRNFVGHPHPLLASRLVDADGGQIDDPGVPGEVVSRSPVVMSGYYLDEPATAEAFAGGWFHSGDSCVLDDDGAFIMVDRYKNIVKTGGENVSTVRVESVLQSHPDVLRAAVVGLPHERWGEAVTAVLVPEDGAQIDNAAVIDYCEGKLAGYECPKAVLIVDGLPETVGGKVLKYQLRAQYADYYQS